MTKTKRDQRKQQRNWCYSGMNISMLRQLTNNKRLIDKMFLTNHFVLATIKTYKH